MRETRGIIEEIKVRHAKDMSDRNEAIGEKERT